jgi:hypothetical protein
MIGGFLLLCGARGGTLLGLALIAEATSLHLFGDVVIRILLLFAKHVGCFVFATLFDVFCLLPVSKLCQTS